MAITVGLIMANYIVEVLGSFWDVMEPYQFLSLFNHFSPEGILDQTADPTEAAIFVSLSVLAAAWAFFKFLAETSQRRTDRSAARAALDDPREEFVAQQPTAHRQLNACSIFWMRQKESVRFAPVQRLREARGNDRFTAHTSRHSQ